MSRFLLAQQAKADLESIWDYIGIVQQAPRSAQRQLDRLYDKFTLLARNPLLGEKRDDLRPGLRMFTAGNYVIFYTTIERGVEVERVIHGARDTGPIF